MSEGTRLAIVICTYNRSGSLIRTLQSLYACGQHGRERVDILVVANCCSDDTLDRLSEFKATHPREDLVLAWIEEPRAGKSYALNTAIAHTSHDALCFIDDDQTVEAGFIAHVLAGIGDYPEDAIYCGRIWPAWDGTEPSWVHIAGDYAIPIRPFPEFDLGGESLVIKPPGRYPSGGNVVVRRYVFDAVGGFSTSLGPTGHNLAGGEDHDFLKRARDQGFSIRYLPRMRQLHAIDVERMGTVYTLRKSFSRSRASVLIKQVESAPRLYMFRKILELAARALFSLSQERRFFFLVRLAASLGELAAVTAHFHQLAYKTRMRLPVDRRALQLRALAAITLSCGLMACFAGGEGKWQGLFPALSLAATGSLTLLIKSLANFSQTGPRIRAEILSRYRHYTLYALIRLTAWAFFIMLFSAGGGLLLYFMLATALQTNWSPVWASVAALLGIGVATAHQFTHKLLFNPGLLVASMHYRMSRLYDLASWLTPFRIKAIQSLGAAAIVVSLLAASWQLLVQQRLDDLWALWNAILFYCGAIIWSSWEPEATTQHRSSRDPADPRPNVLLIGSDTLRADRLGAMGYHRRLTPNIDALGTRGALFANCYVPCARTAPSLISMLTGTWPHTHGIRDNFVGDRDTRLGVATLPQLLKEHGYQTAAVSDWCGADMGKFSLGFDLTELPEDQWNLKYLIRQGPKDMRLFLSLFAHNRLGRFFLPEIYYLGGVPLTRPIGRRARRLLSRLAADERPFFLNIFYSTTHPPFASEWPWYKRFADPAYAGESKFAMARLTDPFEILRRQGAPKEEFDLDQIIDLYDGCVAEFDDEVAKTLAHLDACGLAENTIIAVYSDHGMDFFEHDTWGQGNSARGESSARIPLVIYDPRSPALGTVNDVIRSIDIAPTLADLAGLSPSASMEGVSLAECLRSGSSCPALDAFNETGIWIAEIPGLPDNHLLYPDLLELIEVANHDSGTLSIKPEYHEITCSAKDRMIRRGRWKLVHQPLQEGALQLLFDLETDPECRTDVLSSHPDIAEALRDALALWMKPGAVD